MTQAYTGIVREDGSIILDGPAPQLPAGSRVEVRISDGQRSEEAEEGPTLFERLEPVIGTVAGLPEDLAEQHDHYIHGTPKR